MTNIEGVIEWARWSRQVTAATNLLIEVGLLHEKSPWIEHERDGRVWINFEALPGRIGELSGGQRRVALVAASLGSSEVKISLTDTLYGLDRKHSEAVAAAVAYSLG